MSISSIPSNTASAITPFNPLGRHAVGEENKDSKNSSLKAVEESAQSARGSLRHEGDGKDEKVDIIKDEKEERKQQQQQQKEREQKQEQAEIRQLAARDREVRDHERAHAAVGGQYAGAPSYRFQRGPDGINYAVAGEVSIEGASVRNDPQSTINKAQHIRRAALAPAHPSPQDRRVAAQATQMEIQAKEELRDNRNEEVKQQAAQAEQRARERNENIAAADHRVQSSGSNDDRGNNQTKLEQTNPEPTNFETDLRLATVNRSYLELNDQNARPGSIVSEAV